MTNQKAYTESVKFKVRIILLMAAGPVIYFRQQNRRLRLTLPKSLNKPVSTLDDPPLWICQENRSKTINALDHKERKTLISRLAKQALWFSLSGMRAHNERG